MAEETMEEFMGGSQSMLKVLFCYPQVIEK